jgi:porphobilinogen deaminase
VNTRIRKLDSGEVDALVLALCGLERLGKTELATDILSSEITLPAVGQGAPCSPPSTVPAAHPDCWARKRGD